MARDPFPHTLKGIAPAIERVYKFNTSFTVLNGSSAAGIGTVKIGNLPAEKFVLLAARVKNLIFTASGANALATWDGDFSIGSAPNADADLTDAADFDLVGASGGVAIGAATALVSPTQDVATWKGAVIDNSSGALEVNLNVMIDDASQTGDIPLNAKGELLLIILKLQ